MAEPWALTWPISAGSSPASSSAAVMATSVPPPSGIEPAGGHGVAAGAAAQDLAVDPRAALPGVLAFLEDQDARPFAGHPAVATAVERPAGLRSARPSSATCSRASAIRTRLSGWILESAPPVIITSARPRAMIRAASAIARFDEASASVIVLLGPWQSIRIEMWQASMLGRYFSSQIGSIIPIDSRPQTWKSKGLPFDDACSIAGASSSSSLEIRPAPRSMPIRVGIDAAVDQAGVGHGQLRRRDRELDVAGHVLLGSSAAPCGTWAGRTSSGRSRGSRRRRRWASPATRKASSGRTIPWPSDQRRPDAVRTIAQGCHQAQTGYDHSAFGTKHESLVDLRREQVTIVVKSGSAHSQSNRSTIIASKSKRGGINLTQHSNFSQTSWNIRSGQLRRLRPRSVA